MKFGTLFSGGELAGVGIAAAGWRHAWGVEYDPTIAAVAERNGFGVTVADVLACDPRSFEPVDALHASPVCTRASNANNSAELNDEGTKEAPLDVAMGEKVAEFIDVLAPRVVTIENVYAYRNFKAFGKITAALDRGGYFWEFYRLCAADFGVPQERYRLVVRAVRGGLLSYLPEPTKWAGWYAAIEDLLPTLPVSEFAPWQLARLPAQLSVATMFAQGSYGDNLVTADQSDPTFTITANSNQTGLRAFIVDDQNNGTPNAAGVRGLTIRDEGEPMFTVSATQNKRSVRAWLSAGRVVAMTPRALARFQSVPDWYELPSKAALACKIIGNGVPCLLMQRIYEGLRP